MNKISRFLAVGLLAISTAPLLSSCKKDDDAVTIVQPLAGDYWGQDSCTETLYPIQVYNTAENNQSKVFVNNILGLANFRPDYPVLGVKDQGTVAFEATLNGNQLTFTRQPQTIITAGGDTFNIEARGQGRIDGSKLTLRFWIYGDLGDDSCTFSGDRDYRAPIVQGGG